MDDDFIINFSSNKSSTLVKPKVSKKDQKKDYKEQQFLKQKRQREKIASKAENDKKHSESNKDLKSEIKHEKTTNQMHQPFPTKTNNVDNKKENLNQTLAEKYIQNKKDKKYEHIQNQKKSEYETKSQEFNYSNQVDKIMEGDLGGDEIIDELENFYEHQTQKHKPRKNKNHQNNIKNTLVQEIKQENFELSQEKPEKIFIPKNEGVFSLKAFEDLPINEYLKKTLVKHNFQTMTKIQKKSIPVLLQHKNVIVKSETGSGKTLAYLIPVFEMLTKLNAEKKIDRKDGPYVIILAPTHELCLQIDNKFTQLRSACINAINGTLIVIFYFMKRY